jgi:hypothetical protein
VEAEASIAKEKEGAGEAAGTSAGPLGAEKRKRDSNSSNSSGGDGGNPTPPRNSPLWMKGVGKSLVLLGASFNSSFEGEGGYPMIKILDNEVINQYFVSFHFIGRTHSNIILTLSHPIRGELLYSNSLLSKAPQGGQKE